MVRRTNGFKEGSTFWMKLVGILNYRFDSLHKVCEGVCAMFLKEAFGTTKKRLGNLLKIRRKPALISSVEAIEWPRSCRLYFYDLVSGTATQRLGAFLIAFPMALLDSKCSSSMTILLLGLIAVISRIFIKTCKIYDNKAFLKKLARLQVLLCSSKFSTLKFHVSLL
jgi:hypothetical protein